MATLVLIAVFWAAFGGGNPGVDGAFYNCSKVDVSNDATKVQNCQDTVWCIWSTTGNNCVYDKCLRTVSNSVTTCPEESGFECSIFYLSDLVDCNNGDPIQADRFCRATASQFTAKTKIDECFYDDLKQRTSDAEKTLCPSPLCAMNETAKGSAGTYCYQTGSDICSVYRPAIGSYMDKASAKFCDCLGYNKHCDLDPRCQESGTTCIPDPCIGGVVSGTTCTGAGIPASGCEVRTVQTYKGGPTTLCISTSNKKFNTCFWNYNYTEIPSKYANHPECTTYTNKDEECEAADIFGTDNKTTGKKCQLVDIAKYYYSVQPIEYCTDGERKVPSPSGATVAGIPSIIIYFLIISLGSLLL